MAYLESLPIEPQLLSHWVHHLLNSSDRLKQPDSLIGALNQALATHWVSVQGIDLLSIKRLVELLTKVVVFCLDIIILAKKVEACFIASLACGLRDGNIS